jgi:hypothetical protein
MLGVGLHRMDQSPAQRRQDGGKSSLVHHN